MRLRTIVATLGTAGLLSGALSYALDTQAHADVISCQPAPIGCKTTIVDGNLTPANYWFSQHDGDCEESAADVVIGAVKGKRVKETTIDAYAKRAGILQKDGTHYGNGSDWFRLPALLTHYGVKSHEQAASVKTLETALRAGHRVVAFVNAETIWSAVPINVLFGPPPAGDVWVPIKPGVNPDHTVVVDEINVTAGTVTLTDTGTLNANGATETVPLSVFRAAYATSGYLVDITG